MSTNMRPQEGGDIEAGNLNEHDSDIERNVSAIEEPLEEMLDGGNTDWNVVDIDKWATSLWSMLEDVPHYMCKSGHPGRTSRIPENLREVDRKSYEPCFLSIGPYHHGKQSLQRMEKTKLVILKCFLEQKPELSLKDILQEIINIESAARSFYSDVEMHRKNFVQMLLLDSLYLVVVFCGMPRNQGTMNHTNTEDTNERVNQINEGMDNVDGIESTQMLEKLDNSTDGTSSGGNNMNGPRYFWTLLAHDIFLIENQLPFFVLQKIHEVAYGGSETQFLAIIKRMFQYLLFDYVKLDLEIVISPTTEVHHLLHLCHMFFCPTMQQDFTACQLPESSQMFRLGSAMQLYESGVHFEAKSCSTEHSLIDITCSSSGKMVMPCLHVDDNTNSLLRNLIALEQMKFPSLGLNVSAYAVFLLHLVTTPEDVKLMRRKGLIQHHLASDKEMMYLINRLSVGLAFDYVEDVYSLKPVFHGLRRYSNHRVPRWRAWLKHKYFNNPWTAISLMAASLLLLLTALQTYYSVYSYYHPYFDGPS